MIRIALAKDHKLFAKGLLKEQDKLLVTGFCSKDKELVKSIELDLPNVTLTDLDMPFFFGFGVQEHANMYDEQENQNGGTQGPYNCEPAPISL